MSVYVGIDVHRKRSQVAVVDQAGEVLANRNVSNGVEPILRAIGDVPIGTPAAFEAAFGWGWLVELLEDYGFEPAPGAPVAVQGDRLGPVDQRQGRRAHPGPVAARGSAAGGVDRSAGGAPAPRAAAAPDSAGPAADAAAQPDPGGARRPRAGPARGLLERPGPRLAGRARSARGVPAGDRGLPGADRRAAGTDRPARCPGARPRQGRTADQRACSPGCPASVR
jgi:hypothetical protein